MNNYTRTNKEHNINNLVTIIKGIVRFEINFWYVLAYLKGIQDVGVFVSLVVSILTFFSQTVVYQSYTGG